MLFTGRPPYPHPANSYVLLTADNVQNLFTMNSSYSSCCAKINELEQLVAELNVQVEILTSKTSTLSSFVSFMSNGVEYLNTETSLLNYASVSSNGNAT